MIQVSIDDNKKTTDKKQTEKDAKIDNINKWMENIMDKFNNPSPKHVETNST